MISILSFLIWKGFKIILNSWHIQIRKSTNLIYKIIQDKNIETKDDQKQSSINNDHSKTEDKNIETKDDVNNNKYQNQIQKQSSISNIDNPKDNNHNKNEDNIIETKDNENDYTDQNENNDQIQLLNQYISQIKYTSFPKINKGKTTLFQVQKFSYENEECYNYSKKM